MVAPYLVELRLTPYVEEYNESHGLNIDVVYLDVPYFSTRQPQAFIKPSDLLILCTLSTSQYRSKVEEHMHKNIIPFIYKAQQELAKNKLVPTHTAIQELDLVPKHETTVTSMSSLEIAELTGKEHRNVIRDINNLIRELGDGVLKIEQGYYMLPNTGKQQHKMYNLDRESALLLTSGYSAPLRLKIIRRLDELESGTQAVPALPQSLPDALRLAANLAEEAEHLKLENQQLNKTKTWIRDKQLASAMSTAGNLAKKVKNLEAKLKASTQPIEYQYATVLAVQSRLKIRKVSGLKLTYYCKNNGLVIKDIPDERYGVVHSYPASAWRDVYQIDINALFNRVA